MIIYDDNGQYTDDFLEFMPQLEGQVEILLESFANHLHANDASDLDWRMMEHVVIEIMASKAQSKWLDRLTENVTDAE